jgi:hypothetical protein
MASGSQSPIRKKITPKEYYSLIIKDECFLLHCYVNNPELGLKSLENIDNKKKSTGLDVEPMEVWLDFINVPLYEIDIKDSIDLLLEIGIHQTTFWHKNDYNPCMLTIYKGNVVHNTRNTCYCFDSVTESLASIDLKYINLEKLED